MAWTDFEHAIWKTLSAAELEQKASYSLAISGGLDSMVLLHLMKRLKPQAKLTVAYYHHGPSKDPSQKKYRDDCLELVRSESAFQPNISFVTETCAEELQSESAFRTARWDFFKRVFQDGQPILTAHHLDDWVETLTLKLIRGVGPEGFIAFKQWDGHIFRPFLETPKTQLLEYAVAADVKWKEDPSNDSDQYLRNWLRQSWFKALDEKNPRGYENYSRSLLRLCQSVSENQSSVLQFFRDSPNLGLDRF